MIEEKRYTCNFVDYDEQFFKDMANAEIVKDMILDGIIDDKEKLKVKTDYMEEIRNMTKEELYSVPCKWVYFREVIVIDKETDKYIYDEFIVSDKEKRMLRLNSKRKLGNLLELLEDIIEGTFKEYTPSVFFDDYEVDEAGEMMNKLATMEAV